MYQEDQYFIDFGDGYIPSNDGEYERHKRAAAERQAQIAAKGRDIGSIPPVSDPARRERCRHSLKDFFKTYFPNIFCLPWADFQLSVIEKLQESAISGGQFALAMPRGSGKTKMCERTAIWAALYGFRRFVVIIASEDKSARECFNSIKREFESNELLKADFPEVCYPVGQLEGITNRCRGQLCCGERTFLEWGDTRLTFPMVPGTEIGGTVIASTTLTGRIRGMNSVTPKGESIRPDYVVIDDPQTRESAKSGSQTSDRLSLINSDVLGLAGPGKKITCVMPCTVIYQGDLADQMLNRQEFPEWQGRRFPLLEGMPTEMVLWKKYWDIRAANLQTDNGDKMAATRFYQEHREEMDAGCQATWPARYNEDEISAVQNSMNIYLADKERFFSEYQNTPQAMEISEGERMTVPEVLQRRNNRPKGQIPQGATKLTMFVDVQQKCLFWMVLAVADNFSCWVIDYGSFPEQPDEYFNAADVSVSYGDLYPTAGPEGALRQALSDLVLPKLDAVYEREDGAELHIDRCLIDSGWQSESVYGFIAESGHIPQLYPSKGISIGVTGVPISEYKRKLGETISKYEWQLGPIKNRRNVRLMRFDANWWKSFLKNRLQTSPGDPGAMTICGEHITKRFRMLADHLCSEYSTPVLAGSRRIDVWKLLPGKENHWLDCAVGCLVAASERGCALVIDPPTATGKQAKPYMPSTSSVNSAERPTTGVRVFNRAKRFYSCANHF